METTRQKKVGVFLRKDITEILQKLLKRNPHRLNNSFRHKG